MTPPNDALVRELRAFMDDYVPKLNVVKLIHRAIAALEHGPDSAPGWKALKEAGWNALRDRVASSKREAHRCVMVSEADYAASLDAVLALVERGPDGQSLLAGLSTPSDAAQVSGQAASPSPTAEDAAAARELAVWALSYGVSFAASAITRDEFVDHAASVLAASRRQWQPDKEKLMDVISKYVPIAVAEHILAHIAREQGL